MSSAHFGYVADASALLSLLYDEPGGTKMADRLPECVVATVNLAEVVAAQINRGVPADVARRIVEEIGIASIPVELEVAFQAGRLRAETHRHGLSLGDRVCLALARVLGCPALTCDSAWQRLDIGVEVELLR